MKFVTVPTRDEFFNLVKNPTNDDGIDYLNKIIRDLNLYHQAFSPMAQRNILTSIQSWIRAWARSQVRRCSPVILEAMQALKEVVGNKLGLARGYTHVRCVGWKVGSGGLGTYLVADPTSDRLDMKAKCEKMKTAINAARTQLANFTGADQDDANTLKVFMAPEFYFRGENGAYPMDVVGDIIGTMMKQESFKNPGTSSHLFKDWLFIFGTAVSSFEADPGKAEVHNVALIQKGKDTHTVAKEFVSGIDYKKNTAQRPVVDVSVTDVYGARPRANAVGSRTEVRPTGLRAAKTAKKTLEATAPSGSSSSGIASKFNDERMGGCIFTVDGITFGLEVCLDHIASSRRDGRGRLAKQCESIQVLLIPSWGMEIRDGMYCKMGGIVFNVDGRQISGGTQPSAEVKVRDNVGDAPKPSTLYTPPGIDGSLAYFGPFQLPPN